MRAVGFFRNVNQGQRGQPSTAEQIAAFEAAGARGATPVRSNGTVVFDADDPEGAAADAAHALAAAVGAEREIFVLALDEVARTVAVHARMPDTARRELTLHDGGRIDARDPTLRREAQRRRLTVLESGWGWIVSVNERERESNATRAVERATGGTATSRGIPTLELVTARFGGA